MRKIEFADVALGMRVRLTQRWRASAEGAREAYTVSYVGTVTKIDPDGLLYFEEGDDCAWAVPRGKVAATTIEVLSERVSEAGHHVVISFTKYGADYWLRCGMPPESLCHAVYACGCPAWDYEGIDDDGVPWHALMDERGFAEAIHHGSFDEDFCNQNEHFYNEDGEECITGEISFPVSGAWNGEGYDWEVLERNQKMEEEK